MTLACEEVTDPRIVIADFGEAWLYDTSSEDKHLNTPLAYLPPEATFAKKAIRFNADIWSLACTIFEIYGKRPLFETGFYDEDDLIAEMVSCLGILPLPWWNAWQARDEFFRSDGTWREDMKRLHDPVSRPLRQRIEEMGRKGDPEFSKEEADSLESMLRGMLEYEPTLRATIMDVLRSGWMERWGFPALKKFNLPVQ